MSKEEFFNRVFPEPNTGCWLWAGRSDKNGYGRSSHRGHHQLAHRQSFEYANGVFDYKMHVLHKCDIPACVNPDHLYLGDQRQNNLDRDKRGRQKTKRGTDHKLAKLTDSQVLEIRKLHNPKEYPTRRLAKMYGVSQRKVMDILHGISWKHLLP